MSDSLESMVGMFPGADEVKHAPRDVSALTRDEVLAAVVAVVVDVLEVAPEEVQESALIKEELGADSLHRLGIVCSIERVLNIETRYEKLTGVNTIGEIVDHILKG